MPLPKGIYAFLNCSALLLTSLGFAFVAIVLIEKTRRESG
jgi:hypothetical protein